MVKRYRGDVWKLRAGPEEAESERGEVVRVVETAERKEAEEHAVQDKVKSGGGGDGVGPRGEDEGDGGRSKDSIEELGRRLDGINPYVLGRRTRQVLDDTYERMTDIAGLFSGGSSRSRQKKKNGQGEGMGNGRTVSLADVLDDEFDETGLNPFTKVLVVGATGKVGRILVRKLVLRGYGVRVLVRDRAAAVESGVIPPGVELVEGDVGELEDVRDAVHGVAKVVCCVRPTSTLTGELRRVDYLGVANVTRAFLEERNVEVQKESGGKARSPKTKRRVCDFGKKRANESIARWKIEKVGLKEYGDEAPFGIGAVREFGSGLALSDAAAIALDVNEKGRPGDVNANFSGTVNTRNGVVHFSTDVDINLEQYDGLYMRLKGDDKMYDFVVRSKEGHLYRAPTRVPANWTTLRVPFSAFMAVDEGTPRRIVGKDVQAIGIVFSPKRQRSRPAPSAAAAAAAAAAAELGDDTRVDDFLLSSGIESESQQNSFSVMVDYVKATPIGSEPDVVLVSCAGAGISDPDLRSKVARFKAMGEDALRSSGLGYTVVRPGPLLDEPGGSRALIFDQGDRITQSISCADVADVCLRSLHEPVARNKSFEVCFEYESTSESMYELVTQVKETTGAGYLEPALSVLEENT